MQSYDPMAAYEKIEFGNGLHGYLLHQADKSFVRVTAAIHSGSWRDPDRLVGLAHFTEHMTVANSGMNQAELRQFFASEGGDYHAFTSAFDTAYGFVAPLEDVVLRKFVAWLSRLCFETNFADYIGREREIITREYMRRIPTDDLRRWCESRHRSLFAGTPHARAMRPLGNLEGIGAVQEEDIVDFYQRAYVPGNMSLIVSGGLSYNRFIGLVIDTPFAGRAVGDLDRQLFELVTEPLHQSTTRFEYSIPNQATTQGTYSLEVVAPGTIAHETLEVFKRICSQLLFEEMRERRQLTYSTGVSAVWWQSFWHLSLSVDSFDVTKVSSVEEGVRLVVERLLQSPQLFESARHICLMDEKVQDRRIKNIHEEACSNVCMTGHIITVAEYVKRLGAISFEDVRAVAEMFLGDRAVTTVIRT